MGGMDDKHEASSKQRNPRWHVMSPGTCTTAVSGKGNESEKQWQVHKIDRLGMKRKAVPS